MFRFVGKRAFSYYNNSCSYTMDRPIWTPFWASFITGMGFTHLIRNSMEQNTYYLKMELEIIRRELKEIKIQLKQE